MIKEGMTLVGEKVGELGVGKTAVGAGGIKVLAAKAMGFSVMPIIAVGALAGIVAWEFWKGNKDAEEMISQKKLLKK